MNQLQQLLHLFVSRKLCVSNDTFLTNFHNFMYKI